MKDTGSTFSPSVARPLCWWTDSALSALRQRLEPAWHAWCRGWGFHGGSVQCTNASESGTVYGAVQRWLQISALQNDGIWIGSHEADASHWLRHGLWPGVQDPLPPVASGAGDDAWLDLQCDLATALGLTLTKELDTSCTDLQSWHQLPWSGAVMCRLLLADTLMEPLVVHIGPVVAACLCDLSKNPSLPSSERHALTSVVDALSHQKLALDVHLGQAEVELGMLQSLRVGDVVVLSHELDQPASVQLKLKGHAEHNERMVLFGAHLGRRGDFKAIEAIANSHSANEIH